MSKWRVKDYCTFHGFVELDGDCLPAYMSGKPPVEFDTEDEAIHFIMVENPSSLSISARAVEVEDEQFSKFPSDQSIESISKIRGASQPERKNPKFIPY